MGEYINLAIELEMIERLSTHLRQLMQLRNINEAELARKTNIPQPTLHKILTRKTIDPRVSTLKSLTDYFKISFDELLTGLSIANNPNIQSLPIISWQQCLDIENLLRKLTPSNWSKWITSELVSTSAFALMSKPCMEPFFIKNTILIINPNLIPQDGDVILIAYPNTDEATLRKVLIDGPIKLLSMIYNNIEPTLLTSDIEILGVLVKSISPYREQNPT